MNWLDNDRADKQQVFPANKGAKNLNMTPYVSFVHWKKEDKIAQLIVCKEMAL